MGDRVLLTHQGQVRASPPPPPLPPPSAWQAGQGPAHTVAPCIALRVARARPAGSCAAARRHRHHALQNLAVFTVESKWRPNKPAEAKGCYGTTSIEHPAVQVRGC